VSSLYLNFWAWGLRARSEAEILSDDYDHPVYRCLDDSRQKIDK
jgi:hypothetical protein